MHAYGTAALLSAILMVFLMASTGFAKVAVGGKVALIISMQIRPYLDAAEGIQEVINEKLDVTSERFTLDSMEEENLAALCERFMNKEFGAVIAIGPEAARFVWTRLPKSLKIVKTYTMVLNPAKVIPQDSATCGIPLNIPVEEQVRMISRLLPGLRRVGILYDPRNNAAFFRKALGCSAMVGIQLMPVQVHSKKEIPHALKEVWEWVDGLWLIPDQTIISESLVQYIIREAISNRVVAIGYNRFFLNNGAGLAFILDYKEIGRQTGRLLVKTVLGAPCQIGKPAFQPILNRGMLEKLGVPFASNAGKAAPDGTAN
jgi:ABC-type uncharacterized transport system substrate-binding protein